MRFSRRSFVLSLAAFIGFAIAMALQNRFGALSYRPPEQVPPLGTLIAIELPVWIVWWLLLPAIELTRRTLRRLFMTPSDQANLETSLETGRRSSASLRSTDRPKLRRIAWGLGHLTAGLVLPWLGLAVTIAFRFYVYFPLGQPETFWQSLVIAHSNGLVLRLLIYGALLALLEGMALQQENRHRAVREATLRASLAEARLHGLRVQLQPHFLFNTLNAVSGLMRRDVDAARAALARLSDLLRQLFDEESRGGTVSLGRELELAELYLDLARLRFGERLRVEIDVPEHCRTLTVPIFILQPLLENAIVHGLEKRRGGGRIRLSARGVEGVDRQLRIDIEDDGPGPPENPQIGVGLGATTARLETLHGDAAGLRLEAADSGGARLRLWLPAQPFESRRLRR